MEEVLFMLFSYHIQISGMSLSIKLNKIPADGAIGAPPPDGIGAVKHIHRY